MTKNEVDGEEAQSPTLLLLFVVYINCPRKARFLAKILGKWISNGLNIGINIIRLFLNLTFGANVRQWRGTSPLIKHKYVLPFLLILFDDLINSTNNFLLQHHQYWLCPSIQFKIMFHFLVYAFFMVDVICIINDIRHMKFLRIYSFHWDQICPFLLIYYNT